MLGDLRLSRESLFCMGFYCYRVEVVSEIILCCTNYHLTSVKEMLCSGIESVLVPYQFSIKEGEVRAVRTIVVTAIFMAVAMSWSTEGLARTDEAAAYSHSTTLTITLPSGKQLVMPKEGTAEYSALLKRAQHLRKIIERRIPSVLSNDLRLLAVGCEASCGNLEEMHRMTHRIMDLEEEKRRLRTERKEKMILLGVGREASPTY